MKGSRRLVVDTSIARAAGASGASNPGAKACRDFLQAVLNICHRAVFPPQMVEEWKRHASRFSRRWQVEMESKRKIEWIELDPDEELRESISAAEVSERDRAEMSKDAFLLEAAMTTTDRMVVTLDKTARDLFHPIAVALARFGKVIWIIAEDDVALSWLQRGAKPESMMRLSHSTPKH